MTIIDALQAAEKGSKVARKIWIEDREESFIQGGDNYIYLVGRETLNDEDLSANDWVLIELMI